MLKHVVCSASCFHSSPPAPATLISGLSKNVLLTKTCSIYNCRSFSLLLYYYFLRFALCYIIFWENIILYFEKKKITKKLCEVDVNDTPIPRYPSHLFSSFCPLSLFSYLLLLLFVLLLFLLFPFPWTLPHPCWWWALIIYWLLYICKSCSLSLPSNKLLINLICNSHMVENLLLLLLFIIH